MPGGWREIVWPREHGSWSLALEPLVLGLIVAPSWGGALLAVAVAAAFFGRRPFRIAVLDVQPRRRAAARRVLAGCGFVGVSALAGAVALGGWSWTIWLGPAAAFGVVFGVFDLRNAGREVAAELAGAGAFAIIPAAMVAMAGWGVMAALSVALAMSGRSGPTVLCIRACLRQRKHGAGGGGTAFAAAVGAVVIVALLSRRALAPWAAVGLLGGLAFRAGWLLVFPRPVLRARALGMLEAIYGLLFVIIAGWAWKR